MSPEQLRGYLNFYRDLGVRDLYRRDASDLFRGSTVVSMEAMTELALENMPSSEGARLVIPPTAPSMPKPSLIPLAPADDTLFKIQQDLGECRRCGLSEGRN